MSKTIAEWRGILLARAKKCQMLNEVGVINDLSWYYTTNNTLEFTNVSISIDYEKYEFSYKSTEEEKEAMLARLDEKMESLAKAYLESAKESIEGVEKEIASLKESLNKSREMYDLVVNTIEGEECDG